MEADITDNKNITKKQKKFFRRTELYSWLQSRKGLPYSSSWIDSSLSKVVKSYNLGLNSNQLLALHPLNDEENSIVSQFGHTVHIRDGSTEIFSLGEDY
jgi:methionyl aminopeptidase